MRIYKYPIEATDRQTIKMPAAARPLCVQVQHDQICIWAEVKPEARELERAVLVIGTGHEMPADAGAFTYLGTVQLLRGGLVFHVFIQ